MLFVTTKYRPQNPNGVGQTPWGRLCLPFEKSATFGVFSYYKEDIKHGFSNKISKGKYMKQAPIQTLSTEVINQIAAGEVVERPANLVKELIENSLDAGSSKIEILFSEGGRFVQIKDNGCGIRDSDLPLALSPHSTSKIANVQDIWTIHSYGFRGEALASIAEVSDLTLISRPETQAQAKCLKSKFGKKTAIQQAGSEKGTTVVVQNLFQHTPARLKFLKSEAGETTAIKNIVKAMALSHPQVEFRVRHKNKLLFYWPGVANLQKRAEQIIKLKNNFYTKTKYKDVYIEACLSAPNETASNRRQMWFFVQGRFVEDLTLYSAVMSAYRGLLMHGEYPILVLSLLCPQQDLDVNVHPAKSKVRFKNPGLVFKAVQTSLRAVLEQGPWLSKNPSTSQIKPENKELGFVAKEFNKTHFQTKHFSGSPTNIDSKLAYPNNMAYSSSFQKGGALSSPSPQEGSKGLLSNKLRQMNITPSEKTLLENKALQKTETTQKENKSFAGVAKNPNYWSSLAVLSQAHLTYIVAQNREAVVFIDQHAAHERVLYEKLMLSWNQGQGDIQNRLVPLALDMEESLVHSVLSVKKELLKIGIEIECSGPEGLLIHAAPAILKDVALQKALVNLGEEIRSLGGSFAMEKSLSEVCATMACHSAIRAGQALSQSEMKELLIQMDEFPLSSFCPHGRPVFVNYPLTRLEKDFGRKV